MRAKISQSSRGVVGQEIIGKDQAARQRNSWEEHLNPSRERHHNHVREQLFNCQRSSSGWTLRPVIRINRQISILSRNHQDFHLCSNRSHRFGAYSIQGASLSTFGLTL